VSPPVAAHNVGISADRASCPSARHLSRVDRVGEGLAIAPRDRAESRAIFESRDLAATVYSVIDLRTHFSIKSAIWSEFFSSIIMWPLP
jgi:hypothetical protein